MGWTDRVPLRPAHVFPAVRYGGYVLLPRHPPAAHGPARPRTPAPGGEGQPPGSPRALRQALSRWAKTAHGHPLPWAGLPCSPALRPPALPPALTAARPHAGAPRCPPTAGPTRDSAPGARPPAAHPPSARAQPWASPPAVARALHGPRPGPPLGEVATAQTNGPRAFAGPAQAGASAGGSRARPRADAATAACRCPPPPGAHDRCRSLGRHPTPPSACW
jgi:hypothetical protein